MIDGRDGGAEAPTTLRNYGFLASVRGRRIKAISRPVPTTCFIDRARAALRETCQRAKVATCDKSKIYFSAIFCNANERKHEYIQGFDTSDTPVIHHACFPGGFWVGAPSNGDVRMFSSITGGGGRPRARRRGLIIKRLRVLAQGRTR